MDEILREQIFQDILLSYFCVFDVFRLLKTSNKIRTWILKSKYYKEKSQSWLSYKETLNHPLSKSILKKNSYDIARNRDTEFLSYYIHSIYSFLPQIYTNSHFVKLVRIFFRVLSYSNGSMYDDIKKLLPDCEALELALHYSNLWYYCGTSNTRIVGEIKNIISEKRAKSACLWIGITYCHLIKRAYRCKQLTMLKYLIEIGASEKIICNGSYLFKYLDTVLLEPLIPFIKPTSLYISDDPNIRDESVTYLANLLSSWDMNDMCTCVVNNLLRDNQYNQTIARVIKKMRSPIDWKIILNILNRVPPYNSPAVYIYLLFYGMDHNLITVPMLIKNYKSHLFEQNDFDCFEIADVLSEKGIDVYTEILKDREIQKHYQETRVLRNSKRIKLQ